MAVTIEPRVEAYIAAAAPFAQPILRHIRAQVHAGCPDTVEAIKWSMPMFMHRGHILCNMAAFKAHAAFGFWRRQGVEAAGVATSDEAPKEQAMGQFGRLTSVADLPSDADMRAMIVAAMALIDSGSKAPRVVKPKPALVIPDDLAAAVAADAAAATVFAGFSAGQRREYADWITEAKRAETRASRIAQAVAWIAEGKRRNWKYEAC